MQMIDTIYTILKTLSIIAVFQVVLLIINLIKKEEGKSFSHFMLISLFLAFAIFLSGNSYLFFNHNTFLVKLVYITNLFVFLSAPLLYLFILCKLENKAALTNKDFVHFLPFVLILICMCAKLINDPQEIAPFTVYGIVLMSCLFLQNLVYMFIILSKLRKTGILASENRKFSNWNEASWLKWLFIAFSIVLFLQLAIFITFNIFSLIDICSVLTGIFFTVAFLLVNTIVLSGLSKSQIFETRKKYSTTPIQTETKNQFLISIQKVLEEDKIYSDPLISLDKMAKALRIPKHQLSRIINENYGFNFNDLINQYRINEVKQIFCNTKNGDSIIDIAYTVGYNSKSTFNTAFKKFANMTPSEFIKLQSKDKENTTLSFG